MVDYTYQALDSHFFLQNTCCNFQRVIGPDGAEYMALWNELAPWLKILAFANGRDMYDGVNVVRELQAEAEEDEDEEPNAGLYLAIEAGYSVAE